MLTDCDNSTGVHIRCISLAFLCRPGRFRVYLRVLPYTLLCGRFEGRNTPLSKLQENFRSLQKTLNHLLSSYVTHLSVCCVLLPTYIHHTVYLYIHVCIFSVKKLTDFIKKLKINDLFNYLLVMRFLLEGILVTVKLSQKSISLFCYLI